MRMLLAAVASIVLAVSVNDASRLVGSGQEAPKFEGAYRCRGTSEGKSYELQLEIERHGDEYDFRWLKDGDVKFVGFGVRVEDHVAVFSTNYNGVNVTLYRFEKGSLYGTWSSGDGVLESEICHRGERVAD